VWLLDAHNLLYRYHHAMPTEVHRGRQVHAVRGLARLVERLIAQHGPGWIAVVFDGRGDHYSGRRDLLPNYKAHREPAPAELVEQIDMAREWLPRRVDCSTVRVDDYEADDVIVTLALQARAAGHSVYLITSDKDMHALISDADPEVAVFNRAAGKGAEGWRLYQETDVLERFGVPPDRLLDFLALCGDDSDNIPGVPNVGPKRAAALIDRWGSVARLIEMVGAVEPRRLRETLRLHADQVLLARRVLEPVSVPLPLIHRSLHDYRHRPAPSLYT
jgi:DNA polymerase-1